MVKVNNGWQSHSIDEVESLASQAGSPTSSTSTLHGRRNPITSPRTAMIANIQGYSSNISSITQPPIGDFDLYSRHDQPSRTYESFWRDHSTSSYPTYRQSSNQPTHSPSLSKGLALIFVPPTPHVDPICQNSPSRLGCLIMGPTPLAMGPTRRVASNSETLQPSRLRHRKLFKSRTPLRHCCS